MTRPGRLSGRPELLAGWLFADLLIVLVLVVLGGQRTESPTGGADPSPSSAPSRPATAPPGLDRTPVVIEVLGEASDQDVLGGDRERRARAHRSLVAAVRAAVDLQVRQADAEGEVGLSGRRAAICAVFGTFRTSFGVDSERSKKYALAASRLFNEADPALFPADIAFYQHYHDLSAPAGRLTVKIFLFDRRTDT
ncbi:hypothetical protein [Streptomyces sp. 8N706]|uniref:hypothetical protein n=1 Tax=Streptomyces sp. 8N706 TaxID=3457416 RepID=UPI003FD0D3C0